ncbi:LysR family transcriptional regulator [Aurantivibrio plasticivorans]
MDKPLPNIRHLRVAHQVALHKSISKASAKVFLSQPAITQAINKLEEQLETVLFNRQSTGMYPTEGGEVYMHRVERCLAILFEGAKEVCRLGANRDTPPADRIIQLLTTTQLRALISVTEVRNFSLAGRQLGISQSSIHRAARELENLLQITLFEKSQVGITPTKAALALARAAKLAFNEITQAQQELEALHNRETGLIVVGSMPLARTKLLPNAINHFTANNPGFRINIIDGPYEDLLSHLRSGDIDILIGALRYPAPSDDIEQHELYRPPLGIFARKDHPLHQKTDVTLEDLQRYGWLVPRPGTPTREVFSKLFTDQGLEAPQDCIESSSQVLVREVLLGSDRLAITSKDQFPREESLQLLRPIKFDLSHTQRPIGVTMRSNWHATRSQQRFIDGIFAEQP